MARFVLKALLRAASIFFSILLLKLGLDGFFSNEEIGAQIMYLIVLFVGIPLIFLLINVIANLIGYGNKRKNHDNVRR